MLQWQLKGGIYIHDDVIKWKHFPRYWPFVQGIHRSTVNSPHKASDAELWCFLLWSTPGLTVGVNNREAGDLRRRRTHNYVTVMCITKTFILTSVHDSDLSHIWLVSKPGIFLFQYSDTPDGKVRKANTGPIWSQQDLGGPMLAPWTLLSGTVSSA